MLLFDRHAVCSMPGCPGRARTANFVVIQHRIRLCEDCFYREFKYGFPEGRFPSEAKSALEYSYGLTIVPKKERAEKPYFERKASKLVGIFMSLHGQTEASLKAARKEWLSQQKRLYEETYDHSFDCHIFLAKARKIEREELRTIRTTFLVETFKASSPACLQHVLNNPVSLSAFMNHSQVKRRQILSKKSWPGVSLELLRFLKTEEERLKKELINTRCVLLEDFVKHNHEYFDLTTVNAANLATFDKIRSLILQPINVTITVDDFKNTCLELEPKLNDWGMLKRACVMKILERYRDLHKIPVGILRDYSASANTLMSAVMFFRCTLCLTGGMPYLRALSHRCATAPACDQSLQSGPEFMFSCFHSQPWDAVFVTIEFDDRLHAFAVATLRHYWPCFSEADLYAGVVTAASMEFKYIVVVKPGYADRNSPASGVDKVVWMSWVELIEKVANRSIEWDQKGSHYV